MSMSTEPQHASPETPWSWRFAFARNPDLDKATKAVLQVIAMHTNDCGEGCFPSIDTIALESGYSKRKVISSLQDASEQGWLKVEKHGFAGQKWKRNHYIPQWPQRQKGGAVGALPTEKVVQSTTEGGAVYDKKVVRTLHPNKPTNKPIESKDSTDLEILPLEGALKQSPFEAFWKTFADKRGKLGAQKVWNRKKLDAIAGDILAGARNYVLWRGTDPRFWKQAQGWLNDGRWMDDPPSSAFGGDQSNPRRKVSMGDVLGDAFEKLEEIENG